MISRRKILKSAALAAVAGMMPKMAFGQAAKYSAKVAHLEAPTQPRHKGLEKVGNLVKERTNGEVEFTLYPLSQLGNARQMIEGTQFGAIECTVQPAAFLGGFNPIVSVLDVPYLFPSDRAVSQKLREGPFGQALLKSFESRGLHALTQWPNGRKSLTSNKSLNNLVELAGQKFRVMDSKILIDQFAAVGATAVAINFGELYTSLQTGLVDGQENPLDTITTMKFHEVQKNLVVTEHGAMEDFVLFNPAWWTALPDGHKQVIASAFDEVRPEVERMKEEAAKTALDIIKGANVNVRVADEAERNKLRDATAETARQAYLTLAGSEGEELLKIYDSEIKKLAG